MQNWVKKYEKDLKTDNKWLKLGLALIIIGAIMMLVAFILLWGMGVR